MNENIQPQTASTIQGGTGGGMTLRDYFAAKAMQSLVQALIVSGHYSNEQTNIASIAYEHADAMLAEREKWQAVEAVTEKECAEPNSDGWISVNDRLPEEGKECIVFTKALTPVVSNLHPHSITVDEIDDGDWLLNSSWTVVTHWQPLPEPPKKGDA